MTPFNAFLIPPLFLSFYI